MTGAALRQARKQRAWTQSEAARRLGVSQTYVAFLESGLRPLPNKLSGKWMRVFDLSPALLPLSDTPPMLSNDELVGALSRLGYPGFAYLRGGRRRNPAEALLAALAQPRLDSRVAEALPWLLLKFPEMDYDWLVRHARLANLTNRLGFMVDLTRRLARRNGQLESSRYASLTQFSDVLRRSRLDFEDTFGQESLSEAEREWMRANRPPDARFWHLLTNWRPEFLQYPD